MTNVNERERYLKCLYESRKHFLPWANKASFLRLGADVILKKYNDSIKYFEDNAKKDAHGNYSFNDMKFADENHEDILKHNINTTLIQTYFFLEAVAMENGIKSVRLAIDPTSLDQVQKTHDLNALFKKASISVSAQEADLLKRLTDCIYWSGRYSFPKDEEHFTYTSFDGKDRIAGRYLSGDENLIKAIWDKLYPELECYVKSLSVQS